MNGRFFYVVLLLATSNVMFGASEQYLTNEQRLALTSARRVFQDPQHSQQILKDIVFKNPQVTHVNTDEKLFTAHIGPVVYKVGKGFNTLHAWQYDIADGNYDTDKENRFIMTGGAAKFSLQASKISDQAKHSPIDQSFADFKTKHN